MSSAGASDPLIQPAVAPVMGPPSGIDPQLVQQTKNEIRGLVQEITQLSRSEISPDKFYEEFLRRVVQALASVGGAFWSVNEDRQLKLEYQINLPAEQIIERPETRKRHTLLLRNMLELGQPTLVPPQSGSSDEVDAGNPTEYLLVLATVRVDEETRGIVEIFQRPGGGPTTQRGYLRFLVQMSELASGYLKSRRLRQLGNQQSLWENLEHFLEAVHRSLRVDDTAYTLVNESRRLIGCDRVSVTINGGRSHRVVAVSSLDSLDRRSDQIKRLRALSTVVARAKRPIWYGEGTADLPPQIDDPLQRYVDRSHATMLAVVPLTRPAKDDSDEPSPIGTLVVEQLEDSQFHPGFRERVETVARHGGAALANALDHESLFLLPLWRALGKSRAVMAARNLPRTFAVLGLVLIAVFVLLVTPTDFELVADGRLQPVHRSDVFAHTDGVVVDVLVEHEQRVRAGEELVRMANSELDVQIANLMGRQGATRARIRSVKRSQLHAQTRMAERERLDGELLELQQTAAGFDRELALLNEKRQQLVVSSPMEGQVVTWNVRQLLQGRPVRRGQTLLSVIDPTGSWQLELDMAERRTGHLLDAAAAGDEPLRVFFVLASHPEEEFEGTVIEVDRTAQPRETGVPTVRVKVAIDESSLPELRTGTTVTGRVFCGRRSLGFVLFHELMETVHTQWLLWM